MPKKNASAPKHLLENACLLATAVKDLEEQRQDWWASKTVMIRKLQDSCEDGDAKKVTELHKINNATLGKIESIEARVGGIVKWALGIEGAVEALLDMDLKQVEEADQEGSRVEKEAKTDELVTMVRSIALSG